MGSANRHFSDGSIGDRKRQNTVRGRTYQYDPCNGAYPVLGATPYALATGATGTLGRVMFPGGEVLMHYKGLGQSILGPTVALAAAPGAGRLSVALDQTSTEGVEYLFGSIEVQGAAALSRHAHKVGTSPAAFGKITVMIEDVSGLTECAFGLREAEAFTANLDDYTDLSCLNVQAGTINRENITGAAATVTTATGLTWADLAEKELSFVLGADGTGRVDFYVDGRHVGVSPYSFTAGLVVQPFFFVLLGADLSEVYWSKFEFGYLRDVERGV